MMNSGDDYSAPIRKEHIIYFLPIWRLSASMTPFLTTGSIFGPLRVSLYLFVPQLPSLNVRSLSTWHISIPPLALRCSCVPPFAFLRPSAALRCFAAKDRFTILMMDGRRQMQRQAF
jgi:hypothetical protein